MINIKKIKSICCVGAGYVGGPTMAVIADKCPNITVNVVDINQERIDSWNDLDLSKLPVFEPGLADIIGRVRNKNLFFSTNVGEFISKSELVFISVNTPTKKYGIGAGKASDISSLEECTRQVAKFATGHTIVVEKSTIPVKTAAAVKAILETTQNDNEINKTFSVLSNPEFLAEGTAIKDLENPDRILIGGDENDAINLLKDIYLNWVDIKKIITTNLWSSELSKLASNAFLAQRISSINSFSALCEETGANIDELKRAIGTDKRIGQYFLNVGPGFGGSCFQKDILNLTYLSEHFGLPEVAAYWEQVININNWQQYRIYKTVLNKLFGTLSNKKISIFGFAFKADTNDTRESPAIKICKYLLDENASIVIHDPRVNESNIDIDLKDYIKLKFSKWEVSSDFELAAKDSDAIIILTEWDIYKKIDWFKIEKLMRKPAWVFDTRKLIDPNVIKKTNLNFWQIGYGQN